MPTPDQECSILKLSKIWTKFYYRRIIFHVDYYLNIFKGFSKPKKRNILIEFSPYLQTLPEKFYTLTDWPDKYDNLLLKYTKRDKVREA